uniref:beta-ketoacyl-[acyl-carrier-protein] synthase family protein n=1 Tax=Flavobacterium sp. TaxID=239 RepID=UPI00404905F3
MQNRVVITGLGVVSPNGIGVDIFENAIKNGISGITFDEELKALGFSCQISGKPKLSESQIAHCFTPLELRNFAASGILYGVIAACEAWEDAGFDYKNQINPDWDSGVIFGSGSSGVEKLRESFYKIDQLQTRKLGSTSVAQTMNSGVSAYIGGKLGLGNWVTSNSSACATGTESIIMGFERIKQGLATRMLVGSTSDSGPYIWGGFDALRVCTYKHNENPTEGSRPMSYDAAGFVPSSGAGALVLERLDVAVARGATIYAEVLGGAVNSGGQRNGGSMTAPNNEAVQKCIQSSLKNAGIQAHAIDTINGHLTATTKDSVEISNWFEALGLPNSDFPFINTLKSQVGHCLSAAGSIESVATVLQIKNQFIFPNINCENINPAITDIIPTEKIPQKLLNQPVKVAIKASFGFGDVNAAVVFKSYNQS